MGLQKETKQFTFLEHFQNIQGSTDLWWQILEGQ